MHRRSWFLLIAVVAGLLSLAALVAACDDEEDGGEATPTAGLETPTEEEATPPAEEETPTETQEGTPAEEATVDVSLEDFTVTPDPEMVAAGTVTFNVTNNGTQAHNLRVIKTDLAEDALPVVDNQVAEDDPDLEVVARTDADLAVGETGEVEAELEAGTYVLICNVVGHYELGMSTTFTVQ